MRVSEAIKKRKSIRAFKNKRLSKQQLEKLLAAAQLAPSAKNLQPYKIIVVENEQLKKELAVASFGQNFVAEASVVFAGAIDLKQSKWAETDLAIAFTNIMLQATELGLGSCWVGAFDEKQAKHTIAVPESLKVIGLLPVGYPAEQPKMQRKKELEEIFSWNKFGNRKEITLFKTSE